MLRLVLESHSKIFCFDEIQSYRVLATREHEAEITADRVGFKIPRLAEQLDHPEPSDYGLTDPPARFYDGQKVLFIIRDFRDVVASMLKLRGKNTWMEDWAVPILRQKAEREPGFAERWRKELAVCEKTGSLAAFGALYWAYKNDALLRYLQLGYPVLPIDYESFVAAPRPELRRVCQWLGVEFQESLLHHPDQAHGELFANGLTVGGTDPKRRIDAASVGQWRQWLSAADEDLATEIARPVAYQVALSVAGTAPDGSRVSRAPSAPVAPRPGAPANTRPDR